MNICSYIVRLDNVVCGRFVKVTYGEICAETLIDKLKVAQGRSALLEDVAVERLSDTFKVLADPTRVKIVFSLLPGELCVCEIAAIIGMSQSAVSHQLRKLKDMRLVKRRKVAKMVYYSLDDDHIVKLLTECINHVQEEFHEPLSIKVLESAE